MSDFSIVDEGIPYGVYTWRIDGKAVVDEDFNYLVAPARRGDLRAIAKLTEFVHKELGITDGGPVFEEGARPISEGEWEEQMDRLKNGDTPDIYDLGNLIDEAKYQKELENGDR
jgi:hypothetical protein